MSLARHLSEAPLPELTAGQVIDHKYELVEPESGLAGVWTVSHVVLKQKFILQLLPSSLVENTRVWAQVRRDIRAAGMLGHEHIEFVTDLGKCPAFGEYIVKQKLRGPTFADWVDGRKPGDVHDMIELVHTIGDAVGSLHEIGIVHGRINQRTVRRPSFS